MPPEGVLARCVPGQSARQYEGQGPMDFAAFTGTPGGMPMAFVRCYTGTDGQSHFEDLDLLPPDMERSIEQAASNITFTRSPNGRYSDWHNAPRPPVCHFPLRRRDGGRDRRWHHPACAGPLDL